jgi:hypothetical protein
MTGKDILILLIGLFSGLVINYVAAFTYPGLEEKIKKWRSQQEQKRASQSAAKARKRIEKITKELKRARAFRDNPVEFSAFAFSGILNRVVLFGALTVTSFIFISLLQYGTQPFRIIIELAWAISMLFVINHFFSKAFSLYIETFRHVSHFTEYEKEAMSQIAELQQVVDGEKIVNSH